MYFSFKCTHNLGEEVAHNSNNCVGLGIDYLTYLRGLVSGDITLRIGRARLEGSIDKLGPLFRVSTPIPTQPPSQQNIPCGLHRLGYRRMLLSSLLR